MMNPYERLLASLVDADVRFVTVGGIACALNGHVRATEDVDILVQLEDENIRRLLTCLLSFGEGHARELTVVDFPDEEGAVRVVEDFPLDIFVRMGGRTFADFESQVQLWDSGSFHIPYLGREALISLKENSLRERDRMDVLALRSLLKEG